MDEELLDKGLEIQSASIASDKGSNGRQVNPFVAGFAVFFSILIVVVVFLLILILTFLKGVFSGAGKVLG